MIEKKTNKENRAKKEFNFLYGLKNSQSYLDICRKVYGDDFPEEVSPNSFVTMTDLRNIVRYLNVGQGDTFIDVGCGRGGPGLWIAREKDSNYMGIDISESAVEKASQRAINLGLKDKACFQIGDICETNFPDNFFDGAISIDTFLYIPDILAGLCEVARILRSDALFIFTTWEKKRPSKVNDYRLFLQKAGFKIEIYDETPDWERRQYMVYKSVLESKERFINEMGVNGARPYIYEAKNYLPVLKYMRRIFVVAEKF